MLNNILFICLFILLIFTLHAARKLKKIKKDTSLHDGRDVHAISRQDLIVMLSDYIALVLSFYKHSDFNQYENIRPDLNETCKDMGLYLEKYRNVPGYAEYERMASDYAITKAFNKTTMGTEYDATMFCVLKNAKLVLYLVENTGADVDLDIRWMNKVISLYREQVSEISSMKDIDLRPKEIPLVLEPDRLPMMRGYSKRIKTLKIDHDRDTINALPEMQTISTKCGNNRPTRNFLYDKPPDDRLNRESEVRAGKIKQNYSTIMERDNLDAVRVKMRGTPEVREKTMGHEYDYIDNPEYYI